MAVLVPLPFHINFRSSLLTSTKTSAIILRLLWICRLIRGENWHLKKTSILPVHKRTPIYLSLLWCLLLLLCSFLVYRFSKQVLDLPLRTSFLMLNVNSTALKFLVCIVHCKYIEIQLLSVHWYHILWFCQIHLSGLGTSLQIPWYST